MTLKLNNRVSVSKNNSYRRAKMRQLLTQVDTARPCRQQSESSRVVNAYLDDPELDDYLVLKTISAHSRGDSVRATLLVSHKSADCSNSDGSDHLPQRESMRRVHRYEERETPMGCGPLLRFLTKQLGKPFTVVSAELDRRLPRRYAQRKRVSSLFEHLVARSVYITDGSVYDCTRSQGFNQLKAGCFYVHPDHGTLEQVQPQPKAEPQPRFEQVAIDDLTKLVKVDGLWYVVQFASVTTPEPSDYEEIVGLPTDILTGDRAYIRKPSPWNLGQKSCFELEWGSNVYAVSKRSAGKSLLRKYGLRG